MNDFPNENSNNKNGTPNSPNEQKSQKIFVGRRPTYESILQQFPELSLFFELRENAQTHQEGQNCDSSKQRNKFGIKKIFSSNSKPNDKSFGFLKLPFPFGKSKEKSNPTKPAPIIRDSVNKAAMSLTNSVTIIDIIEKKIQKDIKKIAESIKELPKKDFFNSTVNHNDQQPKQHRKPNNKNTFLNHTSYRLKILLYLNYQESLKVLKARQLHCDKHKEYIQNLLEIINIVNQRSPNSDLIIHATLLNNSIMSIDQPISNLDNQAIYNSNVEYMKTMKYIRDKASKHERRMKSISNKIRLLSSISPMQQINQDLEQLFLLNNNFDTNENQIPKMVTKTPTKTENKKRKPSKKSDDAATTSFSTTLLNLVDDSTTEIEKTHSDDNDIHQLATESQNQKTPKPQQMFHRSNSTDMFIVKKKNNRQSLKSKIDQKSVQPFHRRRTLVPLQNSNALLPLVSEESTSTENENLLNTQGDSNSYFRKDRIFCDYDLLVHSLASMNESNISSSVSSISSMIPSSEFFGDRFIISDEESSTRIDHRKNEEIENAANADDSQLIDNSKTSPVENQEFEEEENEADSDGFQNLPSLDEIDLIFEEIQKYIVDKEGQFIIFEHLLENTEFVPIIQNPDLIASITRKVRRSHKDSGALIIKLCQTYMEAYLEIHKQKQRQQEQQQRMEQAALELTQQQPAIPIPSNQPNEEEIQKNLLRFLFVNFSRHIFNDLYINEMHKEIVLNSDILFRNSIKRAHKAIPKDSETFQPTLKYLPEDLRGIPISDFTNHHSFQIYNKCVNDIVALQFEATPADFGHSVFKLIDKIQKVASDFLYATKLEEEEEKFLRAVDQKQIRTTNSLFGQQMVSSFQTNQLYPPNTVEHAVSFNDKVINAMNLNENIQSNQSNQASESNQLNENGSAEFNQTSQSTQNELNQTNQSIELNQNDKEQSNSINENDQLNHTKSIEIKIDNSISSNENSLSESNPAQSEFNSGQFYSSPSNSYVRKTKQQIRADCQLSCDDLLDVMTLLIVVSAPFELRQLTELFVPYLVSMRLSSQLEFASITIQNVVNHIVQSFGTQSEILEDKKRLMAKIEREKIIHTRNDSEHNGQFKTDILIP